MRMVTLPFRCRAPVRSGPGAEPGAGEKERRGQLAALIFALALVALYRWKAKAAVAGIVLGAALLGLLRS